jgi:5-(carboxyamino)imidazole ribonucleotide synthase
LSEPRLTDIVRIGILGGGQLGRMLALAGANLGIRSRAMDASADAVAGDVCELYVDDWQHPRQLEQFLKGLTAVTLEWENVPAALVERIEKMGVVVRPWRVALATAQDRLSEKELFARLGIGTPAFAAINSLEELREATRQYGETMVLKTRRGGYDGKGQYVIRAAGDLENAWEALGAGKVPLIAETFVRFTREVSIIGARGVDGSVVFYPLTENVHQQGILRTSFAPARGHEALQVHAEGMLGRVMEALSYVGVMALELFVVLGVDGKEQLLANEIAPRVHNSGHWTMDGSITSQFENHMRAVAGLPLGHTAIRGEAAGMVNVIGGMPPLKELLRACDGRAKVHAYGKEGRAGRKVGHVNVCGGEGEVRGMMEELGAVILGQAIKR